MTEYPMKRGGWFQACFLTECWRSGLVVALGLVWMMLALWLHPILIFGETRNPGYAGTLAITGFAIALAGVCFLAGARRNGTISQQAQGLVLRLLAALYFGLFCYGLATVDRHVLFTSGTSSGDVLSAMGLALAIVTGFYLLVLHRAASHAEEVANRLEEKIGHIDEEFKAQEHINELNQTLLQSSFTLHRTLIRPLIEDQLRVASVATPRYSNWEKKLKFLFLQDRLLTLAQPACTPKIMQEITHELATITYTQLLKDKEYQPHLRNLAELIVFQIERRADLRTEDVALTLNTLHCYAHFGEWEIKLT